MKEYVKVDYELEGYKGCVVISSLITDENEIKEICYKDYLENNIIKNIKLEKESN